jgi:cyclic-di-GMP phosphodiesterase, flagellum assembly factor TipF
MRLGALFVAICMALIAASAGTVVYFSFGFPAPAATMIAIVALCALALYNAVANRVSVRSQVGSQIADLSRTGAELTRQVAETGRRLGALEHRLERTVAGPQAATERIGHEISELGTLVRQLAETVAMHESALTEIELSRSAEPTVAVEPAPPPVPAPPPTALRAAAAHVPDPAPPIAAAPLSAAVAPAGHEAAAPIPAAPASWRAGAPSAPADDETMLAALRNGVEANRIDLYLQPIVTLPQRKVRFYEAMSRLRTRTGEVVPAAQFLTSAETNGLLPTIDNLVVFRCIQVLRRLLLKNRDVGLFCNLSAATLNDATAFPQLLDFLEANRATALSLVLEFTQEALRAAGPIENEGLAALHERGFCFSMDNVTDLRLEPRDLAGRGIRFVKVPANLLLNRSNAAADIHPGDLPDLLARFGIDLVAERIESESAVVDLLDCDVRFGQGFLFSLPRPVRAEALQAMPDRVDVAVRDGNGGIEPTVPERSAAFARIARRI